MFLLLTKLKAFARQISFYKTFTTASIFLSLTIVSHFSSAQSGPPQEWFKKYGGSESEIISCWVEVDDGYLIGGSSRSGTGMHKTSLNKGENDYWIIKLDKNGNKLWDKTFGGSSNDILKVIIKTQDNNFLLGGSSASAIGGDKTAANKGNTDFWIVKISLDGIKLWDKTYGGEAYDDLVTAKLTQDGNILLAGNSNSPMSADKTEDARPNSTPYSRGYDYWIIKITDSGTKIFDKTFGGTGFNSNGEELLRGEDVLTTLAETADGGFLLGGHSDSDMGFEKTDNNACYYCQGDYPWGRPLDYWIIKLNADGSKQWDKVFGGSGDEYLWKIAKAPEGQYLLMGTSGSAPPGEPEEEFYAPYIWAISIDEQGTVTSTKAQKLSSDEDDNWFTNLNVNTDVSGYYLLSQENKHLEIVLEKYDWRDNLLWTKSIPTQTTEEPTGEYDVRSGIFEISNKGEIFIGASGFETSTDYWIYKFQAEAIPVSRFFYGGVDLNSANASTKVGNVYYQGDKFFPDFSYTGRLFANQSIPLEPSPDALQARMLRSVVASSKTKPAVFTFKNIPVGIYEVYVYVWEDNYPTIFSIDIQDQRVIHNYNSGSKGSWAKLGPFKANVSEGSIKVKAYGGDANISGIEIWRIEEGLLERALNLNSTESISSCEGDIFEADRNARDFNFTGKTYENQSIALSPATDENTAKMIRSSIYSTRHSPSTLSIGTQTSGAYNVYLYMWEDNHCDHFTLNIDDQITYQGSSGNKGQWKLLGPFKVVAGDNKVVIKASGGDAMISGVKLYRLDNHDVPNLKTTTEVVASSGSVITSFNAYPIPLERKLTVQLPDTYTGKANLSIIDHAGQTYIQQEKQFNGGKESSLDLPAMKPGVYFLRVQYGSKSEIKRLIKE